MRGLFVGLLILNCSIPVFSQEKIRGVVADSLSRKALPFATLRPVGQPNSFISSINGQFFFSLPPHTNSIQVSYISYVSRTIPVGSLKDNDTIFLVPSVSTLGEVIVKSQNEKIKRIVNAAVRNKDLHNPEMYDQYECNIYYKMKADVLPAPVDDSSGPKWVQKLKEKRRKDTLSNPVDSNRSIIGRNNHLVLSETFSKRTYKRPQQLQEIIIASRFSGLRKTYFNNLIDDVLPFHVYTDYIPLNGKDFINPIAKGWQQRYEFFLADEIADGTDTTFILAFSPRKKTSFNSLSGLVYINSDGYAISHFIGSTGDSASDREIRVEQVYNRSYGKWFPAELNYAVIYKSSFASMFSMVMNGHSVIDSVSFSPKKDFRFDKAYPVKLGDSVDLYSESHWETIRKDSLTEREKNTYHFMDSLFQKRKLEGLFAKLGKLSVGRLPVGPLDIDVTRILARNDYEKSRAGIGLYTNEDVSKYFSVGGWIGYGMKDKRTKYGLSATLFPKGNKDRWLRIFYNDDYQNAGNIHIHTDLDRSGYRKWLLTYPDRVKQYGASFHTQQGYWEIDLNAVKQKLTSLYENNFQFAGKNYTAFDVKEASIGLRYAYGEKRVPIFGYYFPARTKYPIFYFRSGFGKITSGDYSVSYIRALMAVNYQKHINRWGNDNFRLEAGMIRSFNRNPFSRSFLLAAKGFRRSGVNFYAVGGFLTMRPSEYFSDSYASFLYKHDFDKHLWELKFSKPFISLAHHLQYGTLSKESRLANAGIITPVSGYHESGLLLNQLLMMNYFKVAYIYVNAGVFYHWTSSLNWEKNAVWVIGFSTGF